jgi:hypothetical protein
LEEINDAPGENSKGENSKGEQIKRHPENKRPSLHGKHGNVNF